MPSASNVKAVAEKHVSSSTGTASASESNNSTSLEAAGALSPLRQAITIIEHKIRNLEKRKSKLESYKELQNAGKELNSDQKTAVAKYNEVFATLDFARDLSKQFLSIATASEKEAKKLAKKEAAAKNQAELARLREILLVQDALTQMGCDSVRDDFLNGRNGAAQLTEADLKLLDDLYPAVTPKHEAGNPMAFTNEIQAAAEHLLAVVDGKPKEIFGSTYSQIKDILGRIHESGYFDQAPQVFGTGYVEGAPEPSDNIVNANTDQQQQQQQQIMPPQIPLEASAGGTVEEIEMVHHQQAAAVSSNLVAVAQPPRQQPVLTQQGIVVDGQQPQQQVTVPVVTQAPAPADSMYYQQPQPPLRPITEMLGCNGNFNFLQDSEVDPNINDPPPVAVPGQPIPSQTFTNQSFVSQAPPPPIPMPPHNFQAPLPPNLMVELAAAAPSVVNNPAAAAVQQQQRNNGMENVLSQPAVVSHQQQQVQVQQQPQQQQQQPPSQNLQQQLPPKKQHHHPRHDYKSPPPPHHHQQSRGGPGHRNQQSHGNGGYYHNNNGYTTNQQKQSRQQSQHQHRNGSRPSRRD